MSLKRTYKQAPSSLRSNPQYDDLEECVSEHLSEIHLVSPRSSLRSQHLRSTYHICQHYLKKHSTSLIKNVIEFDQEFEKKKVKKNQSLGEEHLI